MAMAAVRHGRDRYDLDVPILQQVFETLMNPNARGAGTNIMIVEHCIDRAPHAWWRKRPKRPYPRSQPRGTSGLPPSHRFSGKYSKCHVIGRSWVNMTTFMPANTAVRVSDAPIVRTGAAPGYGPIFNAGLIYEDSTFSLFARGVREGYRRNPGEGPRFLDYIADVLVFHSADGVTYDFQGTLASASATGVWSYEDPRVHRVWSHGSSHIVMTYTDLPAPGSGEPWRIGCQRLWHRNRKFELNHDSRAVIGPPGVADKDAVVFNLSDGRVGLIHRVQPNMQLAVFDSLDELTNPPNGYWDGHMRELESHVILRPSPGAVGVGAGAPPVETEPGLILFFHERSLEGVYTVNVALLDPGSGRVIGVLPEPILTPELPWEVEGDVPNVVFVQGAHRFDDGTIYFTYGAADVAVGAATIDESWLLARLL